MSDDPYEILGVGKDATPEQINEAYRKQARKAHPDGGGSTEEFGRVKAASMVLLDPKMRDQYDRTGKFEEAAPDNRHAKIMELIANFFINSIEASDQPMGPMLSQLDLVKAAKMHFEGQIGGANAHANGLQVKVRKFNKALKRLKSKRKDDMITRMLEHHVAIIERLIKATHAEREMFEEVLVVLEDYSFDPDQLHLPIAQQQNTFWNNPYGGR